jgi:hypothetical protein
VTTTAKPLLGPRSAGAFAVLLVLLATAAAVTAAGFLVIAATRDAADVTVYLSDPVRLDLNDRLHLPGDAVLLGDLIPVQLHVPDLPLGLRLLAHLGTVLLVLSAAVGALALAQLLRTVRAGRPFAKRNATWLAIVAVAVAVGGGIAPAVREAGAVAAVEHLGLMAQDSPFVTVMSFSLVPLVVAVVILGVAEAFRRGAAMADDVDGLV